jgi:hypothetical protein
MSWLKKGLIPGAEFVKDSPLGSYWQIPVESLEKVQKQKPGPKKAETVKPRKKGVKKK